MRHERLPRIFAIALIGAAVGALGACSTTGETSNLKQESAASERKEAARVHTELGQKYMQQGKLEIALHNLEKALSYDPNYADANTVIAVLYEQIGDMKQAENYYRKAAQIKPKGGSELNNYAAFLCKIGRYDEAQSFFDRAIADPFYKTPEVALVNSGTCYLKAGKSDLADQRLRAALDRAPNNPEALFQLATALYEKGDYFKARAFMQRFEAVGKPGPESLLLGRNIELHLGNSSAASDYTRRLLQSFPESQQARSLNTQNQS